MKKLKQLLLTYISIYSIVYLLISFIIWEFKNPFQWIIDIPKYTFDIRICILFGTLLSYITISSLSNEIFKGNKK